MDILSFIITLIAYTLLLASYLKVSLAGDSISQSQTLSDGNTLVSSDGTFELGFFSPGSSRKRYLGIWFKNIPVKTVVWVANRANPINDSNGILALTNTRNLVLTHNNTPVWDIASPLKQPAQQTNPIMAQILDSGNLVVREENDLNPESYLWQSFDHPTDTQLAGMKFGYDRRIGLNRKLTAWKSPDDPAPGDYSWSVVMHELPEIYMEKGTQHLQRSGPWNGLTFSGAPELRPNPVFDYRFFFNKDEAYYSWTLKVSSIISITMINQSTYSRYRYVWINENWELLNQSPQDHCDRFGLCGAYGYCAISESLICQCLKGFKPKLPQRWEAMDWSQGCVRITPLSCKDKNSDGFVKLSGMKVPDTTRTWLDKTMGLEECRENCFSNCSCMAFTNLDIRGAGTGCVMWFGDLIDIRQFVGVGGQDLYVRMDASEIEREKAAHGRKKKQTVIVATIVPAILGILLLGIYRIYVIRRNIIDKQKTKNNNRGSEDDLDLPLLDLSTIAIATDKFSNKNKIGGGFGPVYKGRLADGQEIAVKKLSRDSRQGITEFKNEVKLIAKLQHRNLVKVLGCCIQEQENILVYEYMSNNSLDTFIFDSTKGKLLDWLKRFHIIYGIARGLLYLHQDSILRIIHRDLKASNVLLDDKLNPKISDFGLAKICRGDEIEGSTNRVVGTYGYMAPEYAIDGQFLVKSDVFSFGVLLLEIISGKRSKGFYRTNRNLNLIGHAWKLWNEGKAKELIDPNIEHSCIVSEVLRCIHISLLCVQQFPEDRPSMPSVVLMLGSENELPVPKEPGFFPKMVSVETNSSLNQGEGCSTNQVTITLLTGR